MSNHAEQKERIEKLQKLYSYCELKFKSGNDTPVPQIIIPRCDWDVLLKQAGEEDFSKNILVNQNVALRQELEAQKALTNDARELISEAVDLYGDISEGDYTVDSFTDQPYRAWLDKTPKQSLIEHDKKVIEDAAELLKRHWLYQAETLIGEGYRTASRNLINYASNIGKDTPEDIPEIIPGTMESLDALIKSKEIKL